MQMLTRLNDTIRLQALRDALDDQGIDYRIDNAGMHALMPLPDIMDVRIFVAVADLEAAQQILRDLGLQDGHD